MMANSSLFVCLLIVASGFLSTEGIWFERNQCSFSQFYNLHGISFWSFTAFIWQLREECVAQINQLHVNQIVRQRAKIRCPRKAAKTERFAINAYAWKVTYEMRRAIVSNRNNALLRRAHESRSPCQPDCETTCDNRVPAEGCQSRTVCDKCLCLKGYVRNAAGACVTPEECPPTKGSCGPNQSAPCQPDCETTCENQVPAKGCNKRIVCDKCLCLKGFVRDPTGVCVKPEQCPRKSDMHYI